MKLLTFLAVLAIALGFSSPAPAATSANANSPLGVNLNFLSYYDPEQPFLNIFKTTGITQSTPTAWSTRSKSMNETHEEASLQLDSDGYPTTLAASSSQQFDQVCAVLLRLPASNGGTGLPYRPGQYVILYDGAGALSVGLDGKMVSTSQGASGGRDVFNVANPTPRSGVWVCITRTDPKNHVRNIRVVKAEEESLLEQGNVYTPAFLEMLKNFRVIRAMQWMKIDERLTPPGTWADRAQPTDAGWGSGKGAPLEAIVSLCNAVSADCWINVPHTADDDYITQMATLVHQQLGSTQKVYVEFSNEVWNGRYPQHQYATQQGAALWRGASQFQANRDWYGMRTAQMCDIWAKVWGADDSRVHCVLGAQAGVTRMATEPLDCPLWSGAPCYKHHITDVAVAPYVGWSASQTPRAWLNMDSMGLLVDGIFNQFNAGTSGGLIPNVWTGRSQGALQNASDGEVADLKALEPYHLPLIAYEGGQSILGGPGDSDGSKLVNAYIAANRDSRMAAVYTTALENWKANGGQTYVLYDDVYSPSKYGEWGLLESFLDTVSPLSDAPPKWQAVQNFIANNPCWWSGCGGATAAVPVAPSGFKASN